VGSVIGSTPRNRTCIFAAALLLATLGRLVAGPQRASAADPAPEAEIALSQPSSLGLLPQPEGSAGEGELVRLPQVVEGEWFVEHGPLPADWFVIQALGRHPRILAAEARVAAASQRRIQAEALEDPQLSNSFFPISDQALQTASGRAGATVSVTQKTPWPEKRWTRGAIADHELRMAAARLAQVQLEVEESARLAYYEVWFADQAIAIAEQTRRIAVDLIGLAEARYAAGGSQQDVLRAELQVDRLDDRLIELRRQRGVAEADLAAVVQRPMWRGLQTTAALDGLAAPEQLAALWAQALANNPELRERSWAVARDREKRELACLARYPDFMLGAGWQSITESDAVSPVANGHDNMSFMVGLTLPIWRDRITAGVREASAEAAATARELHGTRDDVLRRIRSLHEQAVAAQQQRQLFGERVVPRAQRALELATADYRGRRVDFGEVADSLMELLMLQLQQARAEASLAGALAQLRRAVGDVAAP
jgi:outer membrane protein TolC